MTNEDIEKLAEWGKGREVQTKNGPRLLRKAEPTARFSELWKGGKKKELKAAGATFGLSKGGEWELCWWQKIAGSGAVAKEAVTALTEEQEARLQVIIPKLLTYQVASVRQMAIALQNSSLGGLDASDTGTGKTFVMLAVSIVLDRPAYVTCPKAVIPSWKRAARHFGIRLTGVCNYELLRRGDTAAVKLFGTGKDKHFAWQLDPSTILVFDECHRMKDYKTLNCGLGLAAIRQGYATAGLSATAADNPMQMKFAGTLTGLTTERSFYGWMLKNGVVKQRYGMEFVGGKSVLDRIHRQIFPAHGTRLRIADLGDAFPETQISAEAYSVNGVAGEINQIYEEMQNELARIEASSAKDKGACILTEMLRARQRAETLKVPAIAAMVEDAVAEGLSVAVFVNFDASADALQEKLKTKCTIRGGQSPEAREHNIEEFQADRQPVIVCNIRAGGVGVSLHGSPTSRRRLSIICPTFSGQDLKQALGRVWRANGAKSIQRIFFAAETIEEAICKQVQEKIDRIDTLNDGDLTVRGEVANAEAEREMFYQEFKEEAERREGPEEKPVETLTAAQVEAVHEALKLLAALDTDYASRQNGMGFNKMHGEIGHSLAQAPRLSPRQAAAGKKIVLRYKNTQLPAELVARICG